MTSSPDTITQIVGAHLAHADLATAEDPHALITRARTDQTPPSTLAEQLRVTWPLSDQRLAATAHHGWARWHEHQRDLAITAAADTHPHGIKVQLARDLGVHRTTIDTILTRTRKQ